MCNSEGVCSIQLFRPSGRIFRCAGIRRLPKSRAFSCALNLGAYLLVVTAASSFWQRWAFTQHARVFAADSHEHPCTLSMPAKFSLFNPAFSTGCATLLTQPPSPSPQYPQPPFPTPLTPMPLYLLEPHPLLLEDRGSLSVQAYWDLAVRLIHPTADQLYITGFHRYKQHRSSGTSEHEFLVADLVCSVTGDERSLLVERGPAPSSTSGQVFSTASSNSGSSQVVACDVVHTFRLRQAALDLQTRMADCLASYKCETEPIPLFEWARILLLVSTLRPRYGLASTNCYWYAESVVAAAALICPAYQMQLHNGRKAGTWRSIKAPANGGVLPKETYDRHKAAHPYPKGVNAEQAADYAIAVEVMAQRLREHGIDPRRLEGLNPGMLDAGLLHAAVLNVKCRRHPFGSAFAGCSPSHAVDACTHVAWTMPFVPPMPTLHADLSPVFHCPLCKYCIESLRLVVMQFR